MKIPSLDKQIIKEYKEGYSTYEIAERYGFKTSKSISDRLKKYGVEMRTSKDYLVKKYPYLENFSFRRITTKYHAYYLGLLLTDGYVVNDEIGLSMTDEDVIKFIAEFIGCNYKRYNRKGNRKDIYRVVFRSKRVCKELERLSITNKKSKTLQPPKLKKSEVKFLPYIIRGIIDGDGWIRKDGKEFFICSMSYDFILWCKKVLEKVFFMNELNLTQGENGLYNLRTADTQNIEILKAIIYYEPFGMKRKYNKLHNIENLQRV